MTTATRKPTTAKQFIGSVPEGQTQLQAFYFMEAVGRAEQLMAAGWQSAEAYSLAKVRDVQEGREPMPSHLQGNHAAALEASADRLGVTRYLKDHGDKMTQLERSFLAKAMASADELLAAGYRDVGEFIRHQVRDVESGKIAAPESAS